MNNYEVTRPPFLRKGGLVCMIPNDDIEILAKYLIDCGVTVVPEKNPQSVGKLIFPASRDIAELQKLIDDWRRESGR